VRYGHGEDALTSKLAAIGLVALALASSGCTAQLPLPRPGAPHEPLQPATIPPTGGALDVWYVNVGQGDGMAWRLPDGSFLVYDCGPPVGAGETNPIVAQLRALGLADGGHLFALIASHGHLDHIGGCEEVLDTFAVDNLYDTWYEGSDAPASYARFRDEVRAEGGALHTGSRQGDTIALPAAAHAAGARLEVLWPAEAATDWDRIAGASLVVRLTFGGTRFCFQGDIETAQEAALASSGRDVACDVYAVGHHGSRQASSAAWLAAMGPRVAVVSFGENGYGHPTPEALCRVQQAGAQVYATHRVGTVHVRSDGATVMVSQAPEARDYCAPGASYWP
jgi:competence protein ComEC